VSHYHLDRRDVEFVLFEQLQLEKLLNLPKYSEYSKEIFDMVLGEAQKIAMDVLAPMNEPADKEGCRLEDGQVKIPKIFHDAYEKYKAGGWVAPHAKVEWGGQGMPVSLYLAATEFFFGACTSFLFYPGLTASAAHVVELFGSDLVKKNYVEKMYSGDWTGTMCLTEAGAGSAVGDLLTSATPNDDGTYNVVGTKIFISAGDHDMAENIGHLVLARVKGDPAGIKGISLFLVPKIWVKDDGSLGEANDVTIPSIEHKMGINACSTCVINFGDEGKCRGYLIGKRMKGIVAMFHMMNEARIVTGAQGMALGNAAYQSALLYAKERVQGTDISNMKDADAPRVTIDKHPDVKRMLATMKAYSEGLRALILKSAYLLDMSESIDDPVEAARLRGVLELLTPICKAYCTDKGFKVTELAIQTYGGYGYIREYPVEQYMRDVKIASLYEGTNGIQAMDLLGRKLPMKNGMVFMNFLGVIGDFIDANKAHPVLGGAVLLLEKAKNKLGEVSYGFAMSGQSDPDYPMLHAVNFLEMMGNVVVGHLLIEGGIIAAGKLPDAKEGSSDAVYYSNKVKTAQFFATNILPGNDALAAAIVSKDRSALEIEF